MGWEVGRLRPLGFLILPVLHTCSTPERGRLRVSTPFPSRLTDTSEVREKQGFL